MMKKTVLFTCCFVLFSVLMFSGCNSNRDLETGEGLFQYKGSYIGDNSAVINIIGQLPLHENFKEVALQTSEEPYGMTITYEVEEALRSEKERKKTAIGNAAFLFALVANAEWIAFDFGDQSYTVTKDPLEAWFGEELTGYTNEQDLSHRIGELLGDDNVIDQLLS